MTLLTAMVRRGWTQDFKDLLALEEFAAEAGFTTVEYQGPRTIRHHPDGYIMHYAAHAAGPQIIAVFGSRESLPNVSDALRDTLGIALESRPELVRRSNHTAYENVCAAIALLKIDVRAEIDTDPRELGRRGRACGLLDMASVHIGQTISDPIRQELRAAGRAKGEDLRSTLNPKTVNSPA